MTLKTMTVRAQLRGAFSILTGIIVLLAALSLFFMERGIDQFRAYVSGVNARAELASDVGSAINLRAVSARNMVLATTDSDRQRERSAVLQAHQQAHDYLTQLKQMAEDPSVPPDAKAVIAEMDKLEQSYTPVALAIVDLADKGHREEAITKINTECRPLLAALIAKTEQYQAITKARAKEMLQQSETDYSGQLLGMIGGGVVAALFAMLAGFIIIRNIQHALGAEPAALSQAARAVADGDLSSVPGASQAPAASVLASLATMQQNLARIVEQVRNTSDSITTGSSKIATGNTDLSQRTEEQASALQQTAATMAQFTVTVRQNAENAKAADQLASKATEVATRGGEVVTRVVDTMKGINHSSQRIADIIGVVDSIAFQTNILALNAAVEAARAGEQGRGFAVVASEVRNLAQRSATAAKEIKTLIDESVDKVAQGSELVDRAGQTMADVVDSIRRVTSIVGEISSASAEQSAGVNQIGQAISQMDQTTQQNAALVEQSAAAAQSLEQQARHLTQMVQTFKLESGISQASHRPLALTAHAG